MQFSFKFLPFVCIDAFIHLSVCRCVCMCVCVGVWACQNTYVEARGQFAEVGSLFPTCGSQKLNSGQVTFIIDPLRICSFSCVCFCFLVFHWASALLPRKRHGWQCAFSEDHIWRPPTVCSSLTWWVCFVYPMSYLIPILCKHWTLFPFLLIKKKSMGDILLFYFSQNSLFSTCWALPGLTFHPQHFCTLGRQSSAPLPPRHLPVYYWCGLTRSFF